MKSSSHLHRRAKLIQAQVVYGCSAAVLETAKAVIKAKVRNCEFLLTNYRQARRRAGSDQERLLKLTQIKLGQLRERLDNAENRQAIFRLEAIAARHYWQAFKLLCRQPDDWRRHFPHAEDPLNLALNIGYTILAKKCLFTIDRSGLLPELGILHGPNSGDALVFDVMECFRQPLVDVAVIPLFSRRRQIEKSDLDVKRLSLIMLQHYRKSCFYHARCESLDRIIQLEVSKLRQAVLENKPWYPFLFPWSHNRSCHKKNRPSQ